MNADAHVAAVVVRAAMANLAELVGQATVTRAESEATSLQAELQETVLALIGFLICLDRQYDPGERAFLAQLVDFGNEPNAEMNFLRRCAERWGRLNRQVPQFFRAAAESDLKTRGDLARSIMREIQIVANNCAITDKRFTAEEKRTIADYLRLLDDYLERTNGGDRAWLEP